MSDRTVSIITDYLKLEQKIGGYECMSVKQAEFDLFYERTAQLINAASVDEIAYTDGGSRGWNALINGMDMNLIDSIITLSSEYTTNITTLQLCADKNDKDLHIIPCDLNGDFDIHEIERIANTERCCIAISQATAQGSICNPVRQIGQIAKSTLSIYIVDATQSIGQIPIDVQELQCDALTATGRKWLRGPRGTGFIYVKDGSPFNTCTVDGSSATMQVTKEKISVKLIKTARQFEMWERNYGLMLGLSNAIQEYIDQAVQSVHDSIRSHANAIRAAIVANDHLQLVGKPDSKSGIVGILSRSEAIHNEVVRQFQENDITVNLMYDWACPLFFDKPTSLIRLGVHHDVDTKHLAKVVDVIAGIGQMDLA